MANLNYNEITREGKEYRSELLVEKVFKVNNKSNMFRTDKGLFEAKELIIDGQKYSKGDVSKLVGAILALKMNPPSKRKVSISGKLQGQTRTIEMPLNSLEKSEEFGGQPAGGTRVNKGIQFEHDFVDVLNEQLDGKPSTGKYSNQVKQILESCAAKEKSPVVGVIPEGAQNQKRPIDITGNQIYIAPNDHTKHGALLTDITLKHANGNKSYLSLKYSSTLTFMNSGVGQIFTRSDMMKGEITTPIGKAILDTFGIDETTFCEVFNEYGKGIKFDTVKAQLDKTKLKRFLQTCIGSGYWMVHGMEGGKVYFWEMSETKNPNYATITGDVEIQYGGKQGRGKRIDIVFSNTYFDFKVNIRNKQGGQYPSHIMCDYTSKSATGKKLL